MLYVSAYNLVQPDSWQDYSCNAVGI